MPAITWDERWSNRRTVEKWMRPSKEVLQLARDLYVQGARRALDLGCGVGRHVVGLAREGYEVYGTDYSGPAIEHCREWLRRESLQATVYKADLTELDYPDEFFDLIVAYNSVYYAEAAVMRDVVSTLHRKLRPGGHLWLTLKSVEGGSYGKGEEIEPNTFWRANKEAPIHFSTDDEVRELLSDFEVVSEEHRDYVKEKKSGEKRHAKWKLVLRKPMFQRAGKAGA